MLTVSQQCGISGNRGATQGGADCAYTSGRDWLPCSKCGVTKTAPCTSM